MLRSFAPLVVLLALITGCSCSSPGRRDVGPSGDATRETSCRDGLDNDGDGSPDCADADCAGSTECAGVDVGPRRDTGFMECTGETFAAETTNAPVDIIWVVDNSGSMSEEADQIQRNLNSFVFEIERSGIEDYHVVMLTQAGFVAVPDPLGSDTSRYRYVDTNVQSHDSFDRLLEQLPMFVDFLRPSAALHVVFVTDDESDMPYATFDSRFRTALGGRSYLAHAIVSPPGETHMEGPFRFPGCTGPGGDAEADGREYWSLATITGGLHLSICASDWAVLFGQLLELVAVPMPIPCRFLLPEPPAGMELDPLYVNVVYTPGDGSPPITIPRSSVGDCTGGGFTWVYDDITSPTEILLCTDACNAVEGDAGGSVRVQFGCMGILE